MVLNMISKNLIPIQIIGVGKVGCALLHLLDQKTYKVTSVSDSKYTLSNTFGLNIGEILQLKENEKKNLRSYSKISECFDLLANDIQSSTVIDTSNTNLLNSHENFIKYEKLLKENHNLILAARDGLFYGIDILLTEYPRKIGINAALNGIGHYLQEQLDFLRSYCVSFHSSCHPVSTFLIESIEQGLSLQDAIDKAHELNIFEHHLQDELKGKNAYISTHLIASAIFGNRQELNTTLDHLENIDPELLRYRKMKGKTTRLIGNAYSDGTIKLAFKEIDPNSPLYTTRHNVCYQFNLKNNQTQFARGRGVGIKETAQALLDDLQRLNV